MMTRIISTAAYAPEQIVTNDDLSKMVDTSDEWIVKRTGIRQRHISAGENTSVFAINAARQLLEKAGVPAERVELVIVASVTSDYGTPSLGCMIQKELGLSNAVAFDVAAACSGFMFALSIADKYIRMGTYSNAIVIGAEALSKIVDWTDRSTCVLFGDGAGGVYVEGSETTGIIIEELGTKGELWGILTEGYTECANVFNGGRAERNPLWYVNMDGRGVFKFATKTVAESVRRALSSSGTDIGDIKYIIPHQANARIIDVVSGKLGIPREKFYMNMDMYGNTSSASIPIALNELNEKGLIEKGDKIMLTGFGGGMTWATMIVSW